MDVLDRLKRSGVVPVVVLDDAKDAVATAKALLAGGVDVMEITFRTAAAADSIHAVSESCPDMLVGAGTVITLEQCKQAVERGAKFIVAPGFDPEVVSWCGGGGDDVRGGNPNQMAAGRGGRRRRVRGYLHQLYGLRRRPGHRMAPPGA